MKDTPHKVNRKLTPMELPWALIAVDSGLYRIVDAQGFKVAEMHYEDNALLIVQAVNQQAKLIKALRAFLDISYDTKSDEYTEIQVAYANAWAILHNIEKGQ